MIVTPPMSNATPHGVSRNIGLDLVRAVAIVSVLLSHWTGSAAWWLGYAVPPGLVAPPGFLGVELFFALSGFLIGTQLLELIERDPTLGGWWRFMMRRWIRTLPLYWLCVAALAVALPPQGATLTTLAAYASLTQNLLWPMPVGEWFAVSWSLSVEEWFYLLFSALLIGAVALSGRRETCLWVILGGFVVIPTLLRWSVPDSIDWGPGLRKVALFRLDAMSYGVVVAKLWRDRTPLARRPFVLAALGGAIILIQLFAPLRAMTPQPHIVRVFYLSSAPLAFALCLPAATSLHQLPRWLTAAVTTLSVQSYALYLVHLTVIDAVSDAHLRLGLAGTVCVPLSVVAVFGLAYALNRWVELPLMARRPRQYPGVAAPPVRMASTS